MATADGASSKEISRATAERSLVSTVCSELKAHLGYGNRLLAKYIIHLGHASPTVAEFGAKLKADFADFPDDLARALYTCIQAAADHAASEEIRQATERSLIFTVEAHLGYGHGLNAKHVIQLGRASPSVAEFKAKLMADRADFPDRLASSLYTFIQAAADRAASQEVKQANERAVISKVCSELEAQVGHGDIVLAEYIIHVGRSSPSVAEFDAKLKAHGAEFPDDFARALHSCIHDVPAPQTPVAHGTTSGAVSCEHEEKEIFVV